MGFRTPHRSDLARGVFSRVEQGPRIPEKSRHDFFEGLAASFWQLPSLPFLSPFVALARQARTLAVSPDGKQRGNHSILFCRRAAAHSREACHKTSSFLPAQEQGSCEAPDARDAGLPPTLPRRVLWKLIFFACVLCRPRTLFAFVCASALLRFRGPAVIVCFRAFDFPLLRLCVSDQFLPLTPLRASTLFGKYQEQAAAGSSSQGAPCRLASRVREGPQTNSTCINRSLERERQKESKEERTN